MASSKEKSVEEMLWETIRSRSSSPLREKSKQAKCYSEPESTDSEVESQPDVAQPDVASPNPGWLTRTQISLKSGAALTFEDGLVAHEVDGWSITSPNMTFIPQPVHGRVVVVRHGDGHYGVHDPIQWPQQFVSHPNFAWLVAVARKPENCHDHRMPIWTPPTTSDFLRVSNSLYIASPGQRATLGDLVNSISDRAANFAKQCETNRQLQVLVDNLHDGYQRLNLPSTRREMIYAIACVQRYWLLVDAWIEFFVYLFPAYSFTEQPDRPRPKPRRDLMGAFTTEPVFAQRLFSAGIPVWFMRHQTRLRGDEVICERVKPTLSSFPSSSTEFSSKVCSTWAGEKHIAAIAAHSCVSVDIPAQYAPSWTTQPTFSDSQDEGGSPNAIRREHNRRLSRRQPYPLVKRMKIPKLRDDERDKFADFKHPWMPECIPVWQAALADVDRTRPAPDRFSAWTYWLPEPALIAGSSRAELYLRNWMLARIPWYYILHSESLQKQDQPPLKSQEWRQYLSMTIKSANELQRSTHTSESKRRILNIFRKAFDADIIFRDDEVSLQWFGTKWSPTSLQQSREILWELSEVGFRYDLLEIDRYLAPPLSDNANVHLTSGYSRQARLQHVFAGRPFILTSLPTRLDGLAALDIRDRAQSLEALRKIILRWRNAPSFLKSSSPLDAITDIGTLRRMEQGICKFYVQTFWEMTGRPPALPRRFPFPSPDHK